MLHTIFERKTLFTRLTAAEDFIATVNDIERLTSCYTTVSLPPERKR